MRTRRPSRRTASDDSGSGPEHSLAIPAGPYRLEPTAPGVLDSLALLPAPRRAPARGEVELEVQAAGLNFRDVMKALGIYPQAPGELVWLGDEVAGRVVAVGEGVELEVGQAVFGVAPAAFGAFATTKADYILPTPAGLAPEDAATLPIAFSTALYALKRLANVQAGERVLIHAAAGGVGQAAIQIARALGAEVFATASEGKHEYLRSLGVSTSSTRARSALPTAFVPPRGAGVDVVLNSLAGEFIPASIAALAPYGRFVEIGKRDIFQNARIGLWPFRNNLSFFAVDMDRIFRDRPAVARALLDEVRAGFDAGIYRPCRARRSPSDPRSRRSATSPRRGTSGRSCLRSRSRSQGSATRQTDGFALRSDATYLITGGTRGLGGRVAEWMATLGARHLVLVGRDVESAAARETARRVAAAGAEPTMLAVDLAQPDAVASMLVTLRATHPPLRGIVHAAGVLADASLLNLDDDRFRSVFPSKAAGALLLHRGTRDLDLDFFISFSSIASVLGNAGQANYAAANAVLDRLAWLRRSEGLAAQSINWGPWSEIGMSATAEGQRMFEFGVGQISPDRGMAALARLVDEPRPESIVLSMEWSRFMSLVPGAARDPFLAVIREETASTGGTANPDASAALSSLLDAAPEDRQGLLETFVRTELAKVLELDPEDLPLDQPLNTVGPGLAHGARAQEQGRIGARHHAADRDPDPGSHHHAARRGPPGPDRGPFGNRERRRRDRRPGVTAAEPAVTAAEVDLLLGQTTRSPRV